MSSKNLNVFFALFIGASVLVKGEKSDSELQAMALAFKEDVEVSRRISFSWEKVLRNKFGHLPNDEFTKVIVFWLYLSDNDDPYFSYPAIAALRADPDLLLDSSQLRMMLASEQEPRRFYILASLTDIFDINNENFIPEMARMLFRDGGIASSPPQFEETWVKDISIYTYNSISATLEILHADFVSPDKAMPHEEQVLILGKWLKANWPGCEKLEIPGEAKEERNPVPEAGATGQITTKLAKGQIHERGGPDRPATKIPNWVLPSVVAFLVAVAVMIKIRRPRG